MEQTKEDSKEKLYVRRASKALKTLAAASNSLITAFKLGKKKKTIVTKVLLCSMRFSCFLL